MQEYLCQIARLPTCEPAGEIVPMQFNGCNVVIYQGNSAPSAPPVLPGPPLPHAWNAVSSEFDDLDMDSFCDF